jgi:hypothetical protein
VFDGGASNNTDYEDITVTVNPINDAPTAVDLSDVETTEDNSVTFTLPYTDDFYEENYDATYTIVGFTGFTDNGEITLPTAEGSVTYTPNDDFYGEETFTFYVTDIDEDGDPLTNLQSDNIATVTITVSDINDPPELAEIGSFAFDEDEEDEATRTLNVTATDIDVDLDQLSFTCVGGTQLSCSVVPGSDDPNSADADIVFTVDEDYNGTESFIITVTDGHTQVSETGASFTGLTVTSIVSDTCVCPSVTVMIKDSVPL